MSSAEIIIVILGLILVGHAAGEITTLLSKEENLHGGTLKLSLIKNLSKDRLYFPYATCKANTTSFDCKIFRESLDGKNKPSVCSMSFDGNSTMMDILTIQDFDDNKVLVYWLDLSDELPNYYIRLTTVRFSDCSTSEARIKFDFQFWVLRNFVRSLGAVVLDGDKIEVAFDNSGFFTNKIDKLTFDTRGNRIQDATTWFTPLSEQSMILIDKLKNDTYVLFENDMSPPRVRLSLLTEYGLKVLKDIALDDFQKDNQEFSRSHDTLRFCYQMDKSKSKVDCITFNENGKLTKNIQLDFNRNLTIDDVHNLDDGGFLLASWTSEKVCYMSKFDVDGKLKATMELPGYKCDGEEYLNSYDNENDQHCLLRFCKGKDKFDIVNKCFGDNDIK